MLFFFVFIPLNVFASDIGKARIENQLFDTLEEAINVANSNDTITLNSDVTLEKTLEIKKTVNINLNNHDIKADEKVFVVQGGSLNLSGKGKIYETKPNYGAITLIGSEDSNKKDYSTISVGKDILLEGWSGIFIDHNNKTGYGILVNMSGSINAIDDVGGGSGVGIYVNGHIKNQDNSPTINLNDTVKISSSGNGIYSAGYATYNINGAYISGAEAGLGIKSGIFNILNGTIIGSGEDKTPSTGNNDGINPSGTAIQIESNSGYAGNIELNIKNGDLKSKNSNVIYEYTVNNSPTSVKSIDITGGNFISESKKEVFNLSDSFKNKHQSFISGGEYSSNPIEYLKNGYTVAQNSESLYEVMQNTIGVFGSKTASNNNFLGPVIIFIFAITLGIVVYLNRKKITNLFN